MGLNNLFQDWKLHAILCLFSIVIIYHTLPMLIYAIILVLAGLVGVVLALVHQPGSYKRRDRDTFPSSPAPSVATHLSRVKPYPPPAIKSKILSSRIDDCLEEVFSLTLKHHVIPTYKHIGQDEEAFFKSVSPQVWNVLLTLLQRAKDLDTMKLVSQDIVQLLRTHFKNFRGLHYRDQVPANVFPDLRQFPYLENPDKELNFLRQVCEVLLCVCLPRDLLECTPVRVFIREYLTCRIFQPTVDMICEPDYINRKLLAYLNKREENVERGKKPLAYKYKDFEDFMNEIRKCEDVEELQTLRQQVITDLIQARAVYKMKHSHTTGFHGKQFPIPIPAEKLKVLMGRDLELYIRQLGTAKARCDRQLRKVGFEEYEEDTTTSLAGMEAQQNRKPLGIPFETIMKNEVTRMYLLRFLEVCGCSHLLVFWISVENLKQDSKGTSLQKELVKIYEQYLDPLSLETIYADQDLVRPIQEFVSGERLDATECLGYIDKIQQSVYKEIQEGFYQNFIWSEQYKEFCSTEGAFNPIESSVTSSSIDSESQHKRKLKSLKMRLEDKGNELSLMPEQVKSSQSLTQRKRALEKDMSHIKQEIQKLEHYIDHTEEWFDTIGQWSVDVHSVDLHKDEKNPLFIMIVHRLTIGSSVSERRRSQSSLSLDENSRAQDERDSGNLSASSLAWLQHQQQHQQQLSPEVDGSTNDSDETWSELSDSSLPSSSLQSRSGWIIGRKLSEFEELHEKVAEICPNITFPPLPKWLNPFQRPDPSSSYWQKYKQALQVYLCSVLKDERLKECEEVFNFVSSASDEIKSKPTQPEKKRVFSLSNVPVIQSIPGVQLFGPKESHQPDDKELDSTVEYIYLLVSEIFELDHFSRVLRKQLVELVQLTYGKSIDREVQDTLNWVFSEPMLIYYLEMFKNSMWPGGKPAPPGPTRSDEDKATTKDDARIKFLKSSPQALQTILGQRNCQIGMRKIFELLQDPKGNKQLFYALLEVILYALVPELEKEELEEEQTDWRDT